MNFHLPTAAIFTVFTALACALGLGLLWLRDRSAYLRDWALSLCALLLGFTLYGLRDFLPSLLGNVLSTTFLLASVQLSYTGYARLFNRPVRAAGHWLVAATAFVLIAALHAEPRARSLSFNACLLLLSLACLHLLLRERIRWTAVGLPLLAHLSTVFVALSRMNYVLSQDALANTAGHSAQVLSLIIGAVGALAGAFGYGVLHGDRLRAELEHLARIDGLTGLLNRRAFDERLSQEWQRQRRHHTPLAVMVLDVDHFKRLNDELGHPTGDAALRRLGQALSAKARPYDVVARIGGEEFCLLLPGCQPAEARDRAQQLLQLDLHVPTPGGARPFTLSIGLAHARDDDANAQALLARADEALYRAKQEGRHRCCEAQ